MVRFLSILWLLLVPYCLVLGQAAVNEDAIVRHYAAEEHIPSSITDFAFDRNGYLWIVADNDNIRLYDGTSIKVLETPLTRGATPFDFNRVFKDGTGDPRFICQYHNLIFRLDGKGHLMQDSLSGGQLACLRKLLFTYKKVTFLNDSVFACTNVDSLMVYTQGRVQSMKAPGVDMDNIFMLGGRLFYIAADGILLIDPKGVYPVPVTGDILKDRFRSLRLFRSDIPHILCGGRLYRLQMDDGGRLSTAFVADLGFLRHGITKVEYSPVAAVTVVSTAGEGLYVVGANPFYTRRFDERFLSLKRKLIFYPLCLVSKDTFLNGWSEFTGKGTYRLLDLAHKGSRVLFNDHKGGIWEGGEGKVRRYDRDIAKQEDIPIPADAGDVIDFCMADTGRLFCLTSRSILVYKEGAFTDLRPQRDRRQGDTRFEQMVNVGDGVCWIGSSKGLYRYDLGENRLTKFGEIPDVYALNITRLSGGSILFTCYEEGFYYLYYHDRFYKIPVGSDPSLKEISSVVEDGKGRIWLATTNGLYTTTEREIKSWCDGETRAIYYYKYGANEGLQDFEFNGGLNRSNALSADGYLAFNSMKGVMVFHQDSVKEIFPHGSIHLDFFRESCEESEVGDSIQLPHDNEGMAIQVRVPYFGSRNNLRIEYSLDGQVREWKAVDQQGRIEFAPLARGVYRLAIRVRTGLQPDDYHFRYVKVVVPYFFYETTGFRIAAGIVLAMILVAVTMVIVRLRREVRLKNARLQENMAIKEKLISLILHDLKTPIYFHSLLLNQLVESDSFKNETSRQLFMDLKNSSDAVLQFTKEFLTWYSSQRDGFRVMKTAFDHRAVVEDLFLVYKDIAARKHLELLYTGEGIGNLFTDRNILTIILRNLLDNAIKYTDAGKVMLIFERRGAHDVITVSDTGYGMPEEKIRELEALSSITFGYRFIFTMAEKIGAHIQVTSRLGSGTSVKIILPSEQDTP